MAIMPMFPVGSVLWPTGFLPLHVFEPRFRALVHECLLGDREFGVVLIERGSEVGGGETRRNVGTVAQIVEAVEMADGRWAIGAIGLRRIRVREWLDDDPYPRADVENCVDPEPRSLTEFTEQVRVVTGQLRRVLGQKAELGDPAASATHELSEDPVVAALQLGALSPFGPADHQKLLEETSPEARLAHLSALLNEEASWMARRFELAGLDDFGRDLDEGTDDPREGRPRPPS